MARANPATISFEAGADAQRVLERRERTDPAAVLDGDAPQRARDVRPSDATPAPREEPAQHHEADKRRVHEYDAIGQNAVEHLQALLYTTKAPAGPGSGGGSRWRRAGLGAHQTLARAEQTPGRELDRSPETEQIEGRPGFCRRELAAVVVADGDPLVGTAGTGPGAVGDRDHPIDRHRPPGRWQHEGD